MSKRRRILVEEASKRRITLAEEASKRRTLVEDASESKRRTSVEEASKTQRRKEALKRMTMLAEEASKRMMILVEKPARGTERHQATQGQLQMENGTQSGRPEIHMAWWIYLITPSESCILAWRSSLLGASSSSGCSDVSTPSSNIVPQ